MRLQMTVVFLLACGALPANAQEKTTRLNLWVFGEVTEDSVDKNMITAAKKQGYEIRIREMTEAEFDDAIAEAEKRPSQLPDIVAGFRPPANMPAGFVRCHGFLQGISSGDSVPFVGLLQKSPGHAPAIDLAMSKAGRHARYPVGWTYEESKFPQSAYTKDRKTRLRLMQLARKAGRACVSGDRKSLKDLWHPDALVLKRKTLPELGRIKNRDPSSFDVSFINGNDQIAFAWGLAGINYKESAALENRSVGTVGVLSIWRKLRGKWRLMIVTEDAVSTTQIDGIARAVEQLNNVAATPPSVKLLTPKDGNIAKPTEGDRFGSYCWEFSSRPFFELAEFDYAYGTRLEVNTNGKLSAGELMTVDKPWLWRVWSISQDGSVSFSNIRTFRD